MRRPAGTGVCWPMISFTFATAFVVRVIGATFFTSGTVVVAIRISLALKLFDYNRVSKTAASGPAPVKSSTQFGCGMQGLSFNLLARLRPWNKGIYWSQELANGAIIFAVRSLPSTPGSRNLAEWGRLCWVVTLPRWLMTPLEI